MIHKFIVLFIFVFLIVVNNSLSEIIISDKIAKYSDKTRVATFIDTKQPNEERQYKDGQYVSKWLKTFDNYTNFDSEKKNEVKLNCKEKLCTAICSPQCLCNCNFGLLKGAINATKIHNDQTSETYEIVYEDDIRAIFQFVEGKISGKVKIFELWFEEWRLAVIAHYKDGVLSGPVWRLLEEAGVLVKDDIQSTSEGVYIYPGFQLGLIGTFKGTELIEARAGDALYNLSWRLLND